MSCGQKLIAELRRQGYRLTPQREMIVEAVAHAGRHITAEEVLELVRTHSSAVNVATVYRTLELLARLGLVSRADLGGGSVTYACQAHGHHGHLVCTRCGTVTEVDSEAFATLEEQLRESFGFAPAARHFAVHGLCAGCRAELAQEAPQAPEPSPAACTE
ncbi:MAG: transcriptional repressor [Anaerolineales bacterium]|nr:transcriptional repressor [Anaerolineales bacterium]